MSVFGYDMQKSENKQNMPFKMQKEDDSELNILIMNVGCQLEKNRQKIANTRGWRLYAVPEILTTSAPDRK